MKTKNGTYQYHYLACIWCGKSPTRGKYAQYCSTKCKKEALGQGSYQEKCIYNHDHKTEPELCEFHN